MQNIKKALKICRKKVKKTKKTHRIIKEGINYYVITDLDYNLAYKEFCQDINYEMQLIFTKKYQDNTELDFDTACLIAQNKVKKYGGIWHVIRMKNEFIEVEDNFFKKQKGIESLAKFESEQRFNYNLIDSKLSMIKKINCLTNDRLYCYKK